MSLDILKGTIHGLVGENGAGKSTLMRILYGMTPPDSGTISIDGVPVHFRSPRDAIAKGVGMVHQHFMLVSDLTVAENIILGDEPSKAFLIDRKAARSRIERTAGESLAGVDLDCPAGRLSLGERQRVEIAKLLYRNARILILDEPTAVLSPTDAERLFMESARLAKEGRTVILITHKLPEVMAVTQRVSVLRHGRLIATHATSACSMIELAHEVVGSTDLDAADLALSPPVRPRPPGRAKDAPLVSLENIVVTGPGGRGGLRGLDLDIFPGQILAVCGVEGNGQSELARLLAGRLAADSGSIRREGAPLPGRRFPQAPSEVGFVPEDRLDEALVLSMTLAQNLILGRHLEPRFLSGPFLATAKIDAHARMLVARHDVRPPEPARPAGAFSGGNQQKAVVARELEENPPLVVASHATRGLDFKASHLVREFLKEKRDQGAAVVLVTSELDEARRLGDRIVILYDGRVAGELDPACASDREIGILMTGGQPDHSDRGSSADTLPGAGPTNAEPH